MRGHDHLSEPEWAQLDAELAADRAFRRAWAVLLCGLAAFWTLVAAAIVGVW